GLTVVEDDRRRSDVVLAVCLPPPHAVMAKTMLTVTAGRLRLNLTSDVRATSRPLALGRPVVRQVDSGSMDVCPPYHHRRGEDVMERLALRVPRGRQIPESKHNR